MTSLLTLALLAPTALVALSLFNNRRRRRGLSLPPGPTSLPFVGSLLEISKQTDEPSWITFNSWSRIHNSDVIYFKIFGTPTIVLNSYKSAVNLLEQRSYNYSDRPEFYMIRELMGWTWSFGALRYSDWWRLHRRTVHQFFLPRVVPDYYPVQLAQSQSLIESLQVSPEDFFHHIEHYAGAIILEIAYGYKLQQDNDPYVNLVRDANEGMNEVALPQSFLVEYLPIMRYIPEWFPGGSFKTKARRWRQASDALVNRPWNWLKESRANGTAEASFATQNLDKFGIPQTDRGTGAEVSGIEEVIRNCATNLYQAGAETTSAVLLSFLLAMTLHPEIQEEVQKEIDQVVGTSRLPDFPDKDDLPFLGAVLSETLRWNPATPLGISHRSMKDDIYEGYFIPGDSTIIPNVWAMLHDEDVFGPNPLAFEPRRFVKQDEKRSPPDPAFIAFGFGRRKCPGRYLAMNSLWIAMAQILTTFTIAKALDSEGKEIEPEVRYNNGILSAPEPFKCRFIRRRVDG